MNNIYYAQQEESVYLYDQITDKPITITNDRINYNAIIDAIHDDDEELVRSLLDENKVINNVTNGRVHVHGNTVTLDGKEIHTSETKVLIDLISEGKKSIDHWFRFIENLHENPSFRSRQQAYKFIAQTGIAKTKEGNLMGYKGVRHDYYSIHGNKTVKLIQGKTNQNGQILNTIGSVIEMDRKEISDDPNNPCDVGLHVANHEYAKNWASENGRLLEIEFSPKDIVSVPNDHNHAKLRVSKYKVIKEISKHGHSTNNGTYEHNGNIDLHNLFNWLDTRVHGHEGFVTYIDVKQAFPGVSMHDIKESIENYSEYHLDCEFDHHSNDYQISFQSLPV